MSDKRENENDATPAHHEQPWREQRHQPEPKGIEGQHAGQRVPEDLQRQTRDDTGVGLDSRVAGDDAGSGRGQEGGLSSGAGNGDQGAGGSHQGSDITPYGRTGTKHATGHGRETEGAFGEETASANANPNNDFRDAAISKREIGPNERADRTQGGDQ